MWALGPEPPDHATKPARRSLFGEILDWMLAPLLIGWTVSIFVTFLVAQSIANIPYDRALDSRINWLTHQVVSHNGRAQLQLPPLAREYIGDDEFDQRHYLVLGFRGEWIGGNRVLPLPSYPPQHNYERVQFRDIEIQGKPYRVGFRWVEPEDGEGLVFVEMAETLSSREHLANEIVSGIVIPQFLLFPLAVFLVWLGLNRGVAPLRAAQQRIKNRKEDDLSAIELQTVPIEIEPFVHSINDLLRRLESMLISQKRFIADAAHQLKTPLAGIRMQTELALSIKDPQEQAQCMQHLLYSTKRATRTVNQLLSLSRAEHYTASESVIKQTCELNRLVQGVLSDLAVLAFDKGIELGFEAVPHPAWVTANIVLLEELIKNVVDNAIAYTPVQGKINVGIMQTQSAYQVNIEDSGPGITDEIKERVFDAFFRNLETSHTLGSGLGLAIVKRIADLHQAYISLENIVSADGKVQGCRFLIQLPLAEAA